MSDMIIEDSFIKQVKDSTGKVYDLHDSRLTDDELKQIESNGNVYSSIKQLEDYLFETQYTTASIDYDFANQYFQNSQESIGAGGCSGIIKDGKVLRQLDWTYDSNVDFIVRRVADKENGIHGSLGMCSGIRGMTKDFVESGKFSEKYKIVPFIITDGINDQGLYIQSNVVPKTYNDGTTVNYNLNPTSTKKCCITMVIRYILDHCSDFNDINEFFNTYNIYSPPPQVLEYGYHFLVAKGTEYGVIELTNSGFTILRESDLIFPIMTNFRLANGIVDEEKNVDWNQIEQLGIGVERFETALTAFDGISLQTLREQLAYTNWYTGDGQVWPTEFTGSTAQLISGGEAVVTVQGVKQGLYDLAPLYLQERDNYSERTREDGKGTWQTVHSSIYDLTTGNLNLAIQERMDEAFNVSFDGSDANCITDVKVDGSSVVNNGVANIQKELYYCTYGTTTFNEVQEALNNNKLPICEYLNKIYLYSYTSTHHFFINMSQNDKTVAQSRIQCKTNGWSSDDIVYSENKSNKVTILSSSSTDVQYPSAKAVYNALGAKANLVDGKVPASELPSYVDDVLEFDSAADFPTTGETGKIYVTKDTNLIYRWGGTTYVRLNDVDLTSYYTKTETDGLVGAKQNTLVSGTNIKTINSQSILGEGNIEISGNHIDAPEFVSGTMYRSGDLIYKNNELYIYNGYGESTVYDSNFSVKFKKFDGSAIPSSALIAFGKTYITSGNSQEKLKLVNMSAGYEQAFSADTFKKLRAGQLILVTFGEEKTFVNESYHYFALTSYSDYDDTPNIWWECEIDFPGSDDCYKNRPYKDIVVPDHEYAIFEVVDNGAWNSDTNYKAKCRYIGCTSEGIDLSGYYTKTETDTLLSEKVDLTLVKITPTAQNKILTESDLISFDVKNDELFITCPSA